MTISPCPPVTGPGGIGMLLSSASAPAIAAAAANPSHRCSWTAARQPVVGSGAGRGPRIVPSCADVAIPASCIALVSIFLPSIDGPGGRS
jgi:hypothetical protein